MVLVLGLLKELLVNCKCFFCGFGSWSTEEVFGQLQMFFVVVVLGSLQVVLISGRLAGGFCFFAVGFMDLVIRACYVFRVLHNVVPQMVLHSDIESLIPCTGQISFNGG